MDIEKMLKVLEIGTIEWRKHALERMFQRGISRNEVKETLMCIIFSFQNKSDSCCGKFR